MNNLIKEETKFKARIIEKTSKGKYKLSVYSDKLKKELGLFFVDRNQMKEYKLNESDINKVIQFKGRLKKIKDKFYIQEMSDIKMERISYSRKERRSSLTKYNDNKFYTFLGIYNYTRENDDRSLFTEIKLKEGIVHLEIDHLNLKIKKELERGAQYSFKGRVTKYKKEHTSGYFYSLKDIKEVKLIKSNEEKVTISKKEYEKLLEIKETLSKLLSLI